MALGSWSSLGWDPRSSTHLSCDPGRVTYSLCVSASSLTNGGTNSTYLMGSLPLPGLPFSEHLHCARPRPEPWIVPAHAAHPASYQQPYEVGTVHIHVEETEAQSSLATCPESHTRARTGRCGVQAGSTHGCSACTSFI